MADISNKTLALLVGIALVVFLINVASSPKRITGAITDTGTGTLNVLGAMGIDVTDTTIDFLQGSIESGLSCVIDSDDGSNSAGCIASSGWLSSKDVFTISNTGTVNISVSISAQKDAATWVTGSGAAQEYAIASADTGDCLAGGQTAYATLTTGYTGLCDNIAPAASLDTALKVTIPSGATSGERTNEITFKAEMAS